MPGIHVEHRRTLRVPQFSFRPPSKSSPSGYPRNSPLSIAGSLHPILRSSSLDWDLRESPSTITLAGTSHPISGRTLAEPATTSPLTDITINTPIIPWTINVRAKGSFISLGDVFHSIYQSLRCNITQSDFDSLPSDFDRQRTARAYQKRYRRQPNVGMAEKEKQGGMKRIDFLVGNTGFLGISNSGSRPDMWYLHTTIPLENQPFPVSKAPAGQTLQRSKGSKAISIPSSTPSEAPPPTNGGHPQLSAASSELPAHILLHAHTPPVSSNIEHAHEQNRPAPPESLAPPFEQGGGPLPTSIDDTQERLKPTNPNSDNRTRIEDPHPSRVEATSSESVPMFGQPHDINISGGEFYAAASINIDASHKMGASTHSTSVSHLWQFNHTWKLPENAGKQVGGHLGGSGSEDGLSLDTRNGRGEGGTADEGGQMASPQVQNKDPSPALDSPESLFEFELERHHKKDVQSVIITSAATSSFIPTIADDIVYDILSNYPRRPVGNLRLFKRILQALIVAFSPLSSVMIAALFDLNDAQHVEQVLLPACPLVFVPRSGEENDENPDRTAVRFICPSIVEFFLDRTRGGKYFVDAPSAHRTLLDGCTLVMGKVYLEGQRFDELGRGWRDAYEYACRNWERHRRAGTRSKL